MNDSEIRALTERAERAERERDEARAELAKEDWRRTREWRFVTERLKAAERERDRLAEQVRTTLLAEEERRKLAGDALHAEGRAEAAEAALSRARELADEWERKASDFDAASEVETKNDDERRTALAKLIAARVYSDCTRDLRAALAAAPEEKP